jgi:hypothetical protein
VTIRGNRYRWGRRREAVDIRDDDTISVTAQRDRERHPPVPPTLTVVSAGPYDTSVSAPDRGAQRRCIAIHSDAANQTGTADSRPITWPGLAS